MTLSNADPTSFDAAAQSRAGRPVLVEFWQEGCGPCTLMKGGLRQLAANREGDLDVVLYDVTTGGRLWHRYKVTKTPTFILFSEGAEVGRWVGRIPIARLDASIDEALGLGSAALS